MIQLQGKHPQGRTHKLINVKGQAGRGGAVHFGISDTNYCDFKKHLAKAQERRLEMKVMGFAKFE